MRADDGKPTDPIQPVAKPLSIVIEFSGDGRKGAAEFLRACSELLARSDVRRLTLIAE